MAPLAIDSIDWSLDWDLIKDETREIVLGQDFYLGPATWMFVGVLAAFLVTRAITRLIRHRSSQGGNSAGPIKDITIGGVHIHHQVFGICLMFIGGLLLVSWQPTGVGVRVVAAILGVGVGLAFDEFALWVHLDDVYWSRAGRKSIDAVALVLMLTACAPTMVLIVGVSSDLASFGEWALPVYLLIVFFVPAMFCLAKGKPLTAVAGILYPPIGVIGAVRLAKPGSLWSRRLYARRPHTHARAQRRFGQKYAARLDRIRDLVAGATSRLGVDTDTKPPQPPAPGDSGETR
jgi:hypothetical protein